MHFVPRNWQPCPGPGVWEALQWGHPSLSAGFTAACARGNFMFCLQGRKAGFHAAQAQGGENSISNTPVEVEEKLHKLSVSGGLRVGEWDGGRGGGDNTALNAKAVRARETMQGSVKFQVQGVLPSGSAGPRHTQPEGAKEKTLLLKPQFFHGRECLGTSAQGPSLLGSKMLV